MTYIAVVSAAASAMSRAALYTLLGLCLLAGLLSKAGAVSAPSTFTVTRTADDLNPGSLRSAIAQAAAVGGTINFQIPASDRGVSSGTATITLSLGPLVVPSSLSIVGPNMPQGAIIVSGAGGYSRVFSVTGGTVVFNNLTIQNGYASPGNANFPEPDGGGGILNTATLTLTNCVINGNASTEGTYSASGPMVFPSGGGINNSGSGASLTMTNCTISQNIGYFGGGGIKNSGTLTATGCLFSQNFVENYGNGGGLFNTGTATLNSCTFDTNRATGFGDGGGAYNTGTLTLIGCLLDNNRAESGGKGGGAVENDTGGTLVLSACTVSRSQANLSNGAGGINNFGTAQITNCLVLNNLGYYAGGAYSPGSLTLINSTFTGNIGSRYQPQATFANGLVSGPATLVNDIFYFDFDNYEAGYAYPNEIAAVAGTVGPTVTYSDVQQAIGVYPGMGNIDADPQFIRDAISSVNTAHDDPGDEHLQVTSPAIYIGTSGSGIPLTDIQGTPRPALPSMGAYEIPGADGFRAQGSFTDTGIQGQATGSQVVAKFFPAAMPASSFTATVDFSDGTGPMSGVISPDPTASGVLQVTASHTYPSSGTFPITVVINGPGGTPTATVTSTAVIQPILASLTFLSPVPGGTVVTATVTLTGVTSSDVVVGTGSSDPSIVRINRGIIIPAGSSSATFAINTFRSHGTQTVTITATSGQVAQSANLTITGR